MTWTLQGMWVSICTMCAITAISSSQGIIANALFYLGLAFFIVGFAIEVVSDQQKSAFRAVPENKEKFITSGLWSKSQHLTILEKFCYGQQLLFYLSLLLMEHNI